MANITKRINKDGTLSYYIRAYMDDTVSGKQNMARTTWKPPAGMRPSAADKEAKKQAALFEEQVRKGLAGVSSGITFGAYAQSWINTAQVALKTREDYQRLMKRITDNNGIGHIRLEKLQGRHIDSFYKRLLDERTLHEYATASGKLDALRKEKQFTMKQLAERSGLCADTVARACAGREVSKAAADKISAALKKNTVVFFKLRTEVTQLSNESVLHYHRFIRAVLSTAKRQRLVVFNVAQEHATPPKAEHKEAIYLNEEQARAFVSALQLEHDVRKRAALTLLIFTGVRLGELCGLSWQDIDADAHVVKIRRASQHIIGLGIVETPTKTVTSVRDIDVPQAVMDVLATYKQWWMTQRIAFGKEWQGDLQRLFIKGNGAPIHPHTIAYWLDQFTKENGLPKIHPHTLRHTFSTLQLANGVDIRTLQSRTGHALASTLLNTYAHAMKTAQTAASNALENVLLKNG